MSKPAYYPFKSAAARKNYLEYYHNEEAASWPVPYEDRLISTAYGPTLVRLSGREDKPPLVLLHGITATSLMWAPNVAAWAEQYRVYAVDTINDYGLSINTRSIWRCRDLVRWLESLLQALGLTEGINMVGMSYGGWLASQFALAHPGQLAKLVLMAPGSTVLPLNKAFLLEIAVAVVLPPRLLNTILRWLYAAKPIDGSDASSGVSDLVTCFLRGFRSFKQRWVVPLSVLSEADWQRLTMPVLFVVGTNEMLYSPYKAIEHLKKVAPDVQSLLIQGAGHEMTFTKAAEINGAVLEFLQNGVPPAAEAAKLPAAASKEEAGHIAPGAEADVSKRTWPGSKDDVHG
jgi:pimeloyl-ACP methyl ester carboxylesterase